MNARVLVLPAVVLAAAGGLALWARNRPVPESPAPPGAGTTVAPGAGGAGKAPAKFRPQPIRRQVVPKTEKVPARIRAPEPERILPTLRSTQVEEVHVRAGQAVKKGDLLVTFQDAGWRRALEKARKDGDAALAAEAEAALGNLEVRAPRDGIVHAVEARRGEIPIRRGDGPLPLVVLFDWRTLSFEGNAPASLGEFLREDEPIWVRAGGGVRVPAAIVRKGVPDAEGSLPVTARPLEPPDSLPGPGDEAFLEVATGTKEVFVVPQAAVRTVDGQPTVSIVTVTGETVPRRVTLGDIHPGAWIEVSGVAPPDSVAVWE
jgi:multidrug efflux pump subunit AcrA (membrane-fusion protein)